MKKRYWIGLIVGFCAVVALAQNGFNTGAYFVNPSSTGNVPICSQFQAGLCVYSPSLLVDTGTVLQYNGHTISTSGGAVTSIVAGTGISVSGATGAVTITNTLPANAVSGAGTYTTATSDAITVTGATSSSHCAFSPTNSTAAAATVVGYVSAVAANSVTITHVGTTASGGTVNVLCTLN